MNVPITDERPVSAEPSPQPSARQRDLEKIISKGRQTRPGVWMTVLLACTTALLSWAAFTPLDWGPLGWVCLVPLLLLVRIEKPTRWMYRSVYAGGFLCWMATLQWMRLGDPTMYFAWLALAVYLALYWPVFLWLSRTAVHRLRMPLVLAVPLFWTGLEYLRAHLLTGFSWYSLGHSQYRWVEIIQISDLFGGYGVSFLVAMGNAVLAGMIPAAWFARWGLIWPDELASQQQRETMRGRLTAAVTVVLLTLLVAGYGTLRRSGADFTPGPRVGLIQGNFVASARDDSHQWHEIYETHFRLTGATMRHQPDVIVWPEAMFGYPMMEYDKSLTDEQLNELHPLIRSEGWKNDQAQRRLAEIADMTNAALVIGISTFEARPEGYGTYNSAAFVQAGEGLAGRYDKIHRVPFGEFIPLKEWMPFLQSATPYRGEFGIDAGEKVHVFRHRDWNLLPLICFEDTVPHLVRGMVRSAANSDQPVDLLVNMTNDGWFHGSSELEQHLITASFRSVETRTPMVRAVNTGISAVIDGDGVVREPEVFIDYDAQSQHEAPRTSMRNPKTGWYHKQLNCALVADVPLDKRSSLYARWGDWFAGVCLIACVAVGLQGLWSRRGAVTAQ